MADYKLNAEGHPVKVEMVEQETVIDVAALEVKAEQLQEQLDSANETIERVTPQLADLKSTLEGVRAVIPAPEEVAEPESDGAVEGDNEGTGEEAPQF